MELAVIFKTILGMSLAYLVGSIPFGYLTVRLAKGIDIRRYGSGSTGTTNVLRTAGPVAAAVTVAGDLLKGVLTIAAARLTGLPITAVLLIGLAVVAGHNWPIFLKFKGGRGVATGFGISLGLTWQISSVLFVAWLIIIAATRYVSLASIIVIAAYPVMVIYFGEPLPVEVFAVVGAIIVIIMHRRNIGRLVRGEESKLGQRVRTEQK